MAMLEDYSNLDYHNPGSFPFVVKALCLVAVMALVLVVAAYAILLTQYLAWMVVQMIR